MRRPRALLALFVATAAGVSAALLTQHASPLPRARYGPVDASFVVSFGARPTERYDQSQGPDRYFENMDGEFTLYVAKLGADSYEDVSVLHYPHALTAGNVHWYLHDYLFGFHPAPWHGLPGAARDSACHVGDTDQPCPGRIANQTIIDRGTIYELEATQVSAGEVTRFFGSFGLVRHGAR